jgi:APA family basic amino acid/polyamine antiporter
LPRDTWVRLALWLLIGAAVYAAYGMKHSTLRRS